MFIFSFKYRLKRRLRDKDLFIWPLLFPICLATFFYLGLSNTTSASLFSRTQVAVIENEAYKENSNFQIALESATQGDTPLFEVIKTNQAEAEKLLEDGAITGYIELENGPRLTLKQNGIQASIIKSFLDEYSRKTESCNNILTSGNDINREALLADVGTHTSYLNTVRLSSADLDLLANYFYALLAMSCLFSSLIGLREVIDIEANLSKRGARVNVAPIHKMTLFFSGISAGVVGQMVAFTLVLGYITLVLKINLGYRISYIFVTGLIANLVGMSIGAFIGVVVKGSEQLKNSILTLINIGGCALAGLMIVNMKYIVATKCPIIAYINPASLITDAFYALYYYENLTRYFLNITLLGVELVVCWGGIYYIVRRKKYASI